MPLRLSTPKTDSVLWLLFTLRVHFSNVCKALEGMMAVREEKLLLDKANYIS
jgi:hypothetical protein